MSAALPWAPVGWLGGWIDLILGYQSSIFFVDPSERLLTGLVRE